MLPSSLLTLSPVSLLILLATTAATTSAQRLRHARDVGSNYGFGPLRFSWGMTKDYLATASATVTSAASETPAQSAVGEGAYAIVTGTDASAQSAERAVYESIFSAEDAFYATALTDSPLSSAPPIPIAIPAPTGPAYATYASLLAAQNRALSTLYPAPTGPAALLLSSQLAAFDSRDAYYATASLPLSNPTLSSAIALEASAHYAAEDSFYATYYPTLTGEKAVAESAVVDAVDDFIEDLYSAAVTASATLNSGEVVAAPAGPILTGTAASAASAALASFDARYGIGNASSSQPTGPDACGPVVPDPSVPDSCSTPVKRVYAPAAYGVQCLNSSTTPAYPPLGADPAAGVANTTVDVSACTSLISLLCANQWQHLGEWVWVDQGEGCALGSFLPPFEGSAQAPGRESCESLVFGSMIDACAGYGAAYGFDGAVGGGGGGGGGDGGAGEWSVAAVNIKVLPRDGVGAAAGGADTGTTGEAVNGLYGSYVVSRRPLRSLSDRRDCGGTEPGTGTTPCAALGSPKASFVPFGGR